MAILQGVFHLLVCTSVVTAFTTSSAFVSKHAAQHRSALASSRVAARMSAADPERRVVVTGMGIVSCLGNTLEDVTTSLKEAKSGIKINEKYIELGMKSHVSGVPEVDFASQIDKKLLRFMGNSAKYCYLAMRDAVEDSGLPPEMVSNPRTGGILGAGGTSIPDILETAAAVDRKRMRQVGPYRVTRTMGSSVSAIMATAFKIKGTSYSISSACSTAAHCIGNAYEQIQMNKQDIVFAGGSEQEDWGFTVMFDAMGALSTKHNDDPSRASRAFDKTRDGFVIAGGGGVLVLEELEHAKARGAKIYGELVGYGANADGYDMVAPSGEGGERCMQMAIAMANSKKEAKVEYVNAHGTSTPVGDVMELGGIKRTFESLGYLPKVGSTKSLSGHSLGAAGVQEAIYSLLMLNNDFLAESAHIEDIVDEAEGMDILTERYDGAVNRVMSNSFGFGGTNCCLIFDKHTE